MSNTKGMPLNNVTLKIVFQPKDREKYGGRRRFGIGVKSLSLYVGEKAAKMLIKRAKKKPGDKYRKVLRYTGIIDFYFI